MFPARRHRSWYVIGLAACLAALIWYAPRANLWAQTGAEAVPLAPADFDRPTYSSPIAMSADGNLIWAVNPDDDSVSVVGNLDTTPSVIRKISVGDEPQSIALDTNNVDPSEYRVYVASPADNGITILKVTASGPANVTVVVETPLLVTGAEPWNVVATPDGQRVFVANSGQDTITVIRTDTPTPEVAETIDLSSSDCNVGDPNRHYQPRGMAVTVNSDRLYVTRFLSFTKAGGVQSDDAGKEGIVCQLSIPASLDEPLTVVGPISLAPRVTGFQIDSNGDGTPDTTTAYPNQMQSIVIRGNQAYVPNIAASPSPPLRFNVDTQAFVNVINNAASGTPADGGALNLHLGARDPEPGKKKLFFANPWAIAFTSESGSGNAYVVSSGSDLLVKLNVDTNGVLTFTGDISTTRYIDLNNPADAATSGAKAGKNPLGIVIRNVAPGNNKAFVLNYLSRNISVVNLESDAVAQVIGLTALPPIGSQDEQFQVGKEMFFSSRGHFDRLGGTTVATDERLSSEGWQNCASCHFQGLTDGVIWRFGSGPRKSVPLNGTWSPHNPDDQRILNYSAIFDEVQDFELNIRNVSGPGPTSAGPPPVLDPVHGLIFGTTINDAPAAVPPLIPLANAGRPQFTVTLPGSGTAWPALDALKEWIRFGIRTPNGALTTAELTDPTGGLNPTDVTIGRRLFFQAGCQKCHGGTKWSVSNKDFISPPAPSEVLTEADGNGASAPNPNTGQFLPRFLRDIGSFNLNVNGAVPLNQIPGQLLIGGVEKDTTGRDALGLDYDANGQGAGFNIPALLGIWAVQPYYHNGACETLACVLANETHRRQGRPGQADLLAGATNQQRVVAFLKTLDAETDFPFNLSVARHDIFVDPPVIFKGTQVVVGANVSLFGVRSDLLDLAADLNITEFTVRFDLSPIAGNAPVNVLVPVSAFTQDFGQAVVTTTWAIPADAASLGLIQVTVDQTGLFPEANENDNTARRRVLIRTSPPDTTPPQVTLTRISDDNPFNDNDAVVQTNAVQVKIQATDPPGNVAASGVKDFCIVSYVYDFVLRRWIPQACTFAPLPAAEPGAPDTFIVNTTLQARAGVAYAFVWVRDAAGNISRTPGFDVVSFVPGTPIDLNRNDVLILRLPLAAGQNLEITADLETAGFGDVDISVFDDFTNANATRLTTSANNGPVNETVTISGEGRRQVEIRAFANSRFTLNIVQTAQVAVDQPVSAEALAAGEGISVFGPPARQTAIGEDFSALFLPFTQR